MRRLIEFIYVINTFENLFYDRVIIWLWQLISRLQQCGKLAANLMIITNLMGLSGKRRKILKILRLELKEKITKSLLNFQPNDNWLRSNVRARFNKVKVMQQRAQDCNRYISQALSRCHSTFLMPGHLWHMDCQLSIAKIPDPSKIDEQFNGQANSGRTSLQF